MNTSRPESTPPAHQQRKPPRDFAAVLPLLVGSAVGAAGGSTFVLANASALVPPRPGLTLVAWGVLALGWLAATLLHRHDPAVARPRRHALTIYVTSVVATLVLIPLATTAFGTLEAEPLRPGAIAAAVGLFVTPTAGPAAAVLAGLTMLASITLYNLRH